jgi:hypothetical protein
MATEPAPDKMDPQPWHQLPEEGAKPYAAFGLYLEMGPERDLKRLAVQIAKSYSLVRRWSSQYRWRERARAFDAARGRQALQEAADSWRDFVRGQQRELQKLWRLGVALVQRFVRWDASTEQWSIDARLGPREVLALLKLVAYLLERANPQQGGAEEGPPIYELHWGEAEEGAPAGHTRRGGLSHPGLQRLFEIAASDETRPIPTEETRS